MEKRYYSEYSQCLDRNMDFIVYGHSGVPLLVFPAQDGHPQDYENFGMVDVIKDKIEKIPAGLMKYFNNLKEVYVDLKEKQSFNQSLLEVERIILLMEKDYQLYPFESFVSELKIHYSKEYYILMKLLEIVMKDCQEAKLGRETVKLTLSLMMNQKLRLKIFGF